MRWVMQFVEVLFKFGWWHVLTKGVSRLLKAWELLHSPICVAYLIMWIHCWGGRAVYQTLNLFFQTNSLSVLSSFTCRKLTSTGAYGFFNLSKLYLSRMWSCKSSEAHLNVCVLYLFLYLDLYFSKTYSCFYAGRKVYCKILNRLEYFIFIVLGVQSSFINCSVVISFLLWLRLYSN